MLSTLLVFTLELSFVAHFISLHPFLKHNYKFLSFFLLSMFHSFKFSSHCCCLSEKKNKIKKFLSFYSKKENSIQTSTMLFVLFSRCEQSSWSNIWKYFNLLFIDAEQHQQQQHVAPFLSINISFGKVIGTIFLPPFSSLPSFHLG